MKFRGVFCLVRILISITVVEFQRKKKKQFPPHIRDLKIEAWPYNLTAKGNLRFAVSGFTLSVCPYLGIKIRGLVARGCHVCFYSSVHSILAEKVQHLISERVLKRINSSQTWDFDVLECEKPCSKSLNSGARSSRTNLNLKPQT